jgi:hypothetical protein
VKDYYSFGRVACGLVDYVNHPERWGVKSRDFYMGKYLGLTLFLFRVPRKGCELYEFCEHWILKTRINKEIDFIPDH